MIAKPLLPQQTVTMKGDAPSRDLVEIIQRIVQDILSGEEAVAGLDARTDALEAVAISSAPGSAPRYACRAWVNFNGTGTVAIRASGNVASITDNGAGDYTVNFTTAMPDADYVVLVSSGDNTTAPFAFVADATAARTTTSVRVRTTSGAFVQTDSSRVNVAIFR